MHTFSELMDEYAAHASKEQMEELADLTNDFVEDVLTQKVKNYLFAP